VPSTRRLRGAGYGVGVGLGRVGFVRAGARIEPRPRASTPTFRAVPSTRTFEPCHSLATEVTAPACRCPHAGGPTLRGLAECDPVTPPRGPDVRGADRRELCPLPCLPPSVDYGRPGGRQRAALPRGPTPDDGIALNLQAAPAVVVTQYEADLAGDGWTTPEEFRPMQGGFVSSERRRGGPTARVTRPGSDRHRRSAGRWVE
jgi:hypothetical protein